GLSVAAQEHPAAVSSPDSPRIGGTVSRDDRDPARTPGPSLHRGGARRTGYSLLAASRAESHSALGPYRSGQSPHHRVGIAPDAARYRRAYSTRAASADRPRPSVNGH